MTIEVKQLIIRSQVTRDMSDRASESAPPLAHDDAELRKLRAAILKECRALIATQLREARDR